MSLSQALNVSASGLRAAQAGLTLVSSNVANAGTPGYVRKTLVQTEIGNGLGTSVSVAGVNRELDIYTQRQLRTETSGGAYADLRAEFYSRLQLVYGAPGSGTAVETVFNNFTTALQALATSPDSAAARSAAVNAAQTMAQQLNGMSAAIQGLRSDAERGLADAAGSANDAMQGIARLNRQLAGMSPSSAGAAALMDQRDAYVDQLSQLMDIRVVDNGQSGVSVFTNSGVELVGVQAAQIQFTPQGTMTPDALWSSDPAKRSVGTLTLVSPNGGSLDLLASNSIRSGSIAALVDMRDNVLPAAQAQLDGFAAAMAQALSNTTTAGTPAASGAQNGFDLDLSGLASGNSMKVGYTDIASGTAKTVTFVRVDSAGALPLSAGTDPNNTIVGIDFSGGPASVAAQVASALGADFTVSNPSGSTLRILDDGGVAVSMTSASATRTASGFSSGGAALPLFVDSQGLYSGAVTSGSAQIRGFAGRISVNAAVVADPSKLVMMSGTTAAGDATRPSFILDQLTQASLSVTVPGAGGASSPTMQTTLSGFLRQVIVQQGQDAAAASSLQQGQQVVVDSLRQRMSEKSSVSIDEEMTQLLALQSAYSANARVLSAVKEMLDTLSRI